MNSPTPYYFKLITLSCAAIFFSACSVDNQEQSSRQSTPLPEVSQTQPIKPKPQKVLRQESINDEMQDSTAIESGEAEILPFAAAPAAISPRLYAGGQKRLKTTGYIMPPPAPVVEQNRENYLEYDENPIVAVAEKPVSTLSIDVDTAAYSNMRRLLMQGQLPPKDAIKAEELINYFSYPYPNPQNTNTPFSITTEIAPSPWNADKHLLHVGIQGYDVAEENIPPANLVFLVDVSGSMQSPNKLGLVKKSLKLLLKQLNQEDKVSLVVYAGAAGVVLEPTSAAEKHKIEQALDRLTAGGSTNGEAGIIEAYAMAQQGFIKGGINRVIIASDGDMNVGRFKLKALKELIEQKRKSGIALTTLGFGSGNYNYALMEQLADVGNGNAAYIDNLLEAQKVLVNEMTSTLLTIAKDVKIQIEFSPRVKEYRLIGYENRLLKREDFNNDKVDAGEIGAGHSVTALYEISLTGRPGSLEPLRYQHAANQATQSETQFANELAFLKIRYKQPSGDKSQLIQQAVTMEQILDDLDKSSQRFQFSASVAAFAQQLRGGKYLGNYDYSQILSLARQSKGDDPYGYRGEFIKLVELAKNLSPSVAAANQQ